MPLLVMEKFCDFFTLRPFYLITTLTYVLRNNVDLVFPVESVLVEKQNWYKLNFLALQI